MATYPTDPIAVPRLERVAEPAVFRRQIWSTVIALGRRWGQLWPRG